MNGLDATLLWCVGQASLLAAMGVAAAMLLTRRAPWAAASTSVVAVVAVIAVTVLAPIELPTFAAMEPVDATSAIASSVETPPALLDSSTRSQDRGVGIAIGPLFRELSRALSQAAEVAPQAAPRTFEAGVWIGGITIAAGVLRLAFAFAWVLKLRRGSLPVEDPRVLGVFDELCAQLRLKRRPALHETAAIASPAVIGWQRRIVLIPLQRSGWDERQLRATLAHELAHVARGDFEWRLAASVMRAVHFFNPLAHWLARRLTLAQELAADRMAAGVAGGAAQYAAALASLALTLDRPQRIGAEAILLPVFSHNLSRRLTMLRSTDGSTRGGRRSLAGIAAGCAIVLAAVATTALRSRVEATETKAAAKVVERTLFGDKGPDVSFMGPVDLGLIVVRVDAITQIKELAMLTSIAQEALNYITPLAKARGDDATVLHLSQIDYLACSMRRVTAEEAAGNPLLGPEGTDGMISEIAIRWRETARMEAWLAACRLVAEEGNKDGFTYLRAKFGEAEGGAAGAAYYLAQRDTHTIVGSYSVERLRKLALEDGSQQATPWEALAGGLVRCQLNLKALPEGMDLDALLMETPLAMFFSATVAKGEVNPYAEARKAIAQTADAIYVGLDFNPATQQIGVRIALAAKDEVAARGMASSFEVIQAVWKAMDNFYQKELAASPEELRGSDVQLLPGIDGIVAGLRMLAEATCSVRARGAEGADAWVEMTGELPDSARAYLSGGVDYGDRGYRNGAHMPTAQPVRTMTPVVRAADGGPESPGLFGRPIDATMLLGSAEQGAFVVRVSELAEVPALAQGVPLLNAMIHEQLTQQADVAPQDIPEIHVEAIEWIAGVPRLKVKPKTGTEKGQEGQVMFECDGFVVRFRDKVDWKAWLARAMPATEVHEAGEGEDFCYLKLPPIPGVPAFSAIPFVVAARDERTLVLAADMPQLRQLLHSTGADATAGLGAEWKELDGGLATLIAKIDAKAPLGQPDEPGARLMISLLEKSSEFGLAFDTDPVTRAAQVRWTMMAADQAGAEQIKATLHEMLPMCVEQLQAEIAAPTQLHVDANAPYEAVQTVGDANTNRQVAEFWWAILKDCKPQIVPRADGRVQVQLTATATLPSSLMVAYEYNYKEKDAAEDKDEAARR